MSKTINARLESLDVLRGLDIFLLVFLQPIFRHLAYASDGVIGDVFNAVFTHVEWEGFHLWDMVMPLFLFMAGTSIPYAFSNYKKGKVEAPTMLKRIFKRVCILWIFGAILQGNILSLNTESLYLYSNTLQSIATGYLIAALLYMFVSIRSVIIVTVLLPIVYTIGMMIYGGFEQGTNLAEMIDRAILGRFLDGASVNESGEVVFLDSYHCSWIYSTLNFTATVLSGLLTGYLLKSDRLPMKKVSILLFVGVGCVIGALGLSTIEPIIKRLWTSSMTLLTSGYSILLMAAFYYIIDVKKMRKGLLFLKVFGMNAILAYMLYNTLEISSLINFWFHGFEQFIGAFYPFLQELIKVSIIYYILFVCYKRKIFLSV